MGNLNSDQSVVFVGTLSAEGLTLASNLETLGYRVIQCSEPVRFSTMLANQKFDCIILEQVVGDTNSKAIVNLVRRGARHVNFQSPIYVISADVNATLITQIGRYVAAIIVRPFECKEILERILKEIPLIHSSEKSMARG